MPWSHELYGSGTQIVINRQFGDRHPHLYVYGPADQDEARQTRNRCQVCEDLMHWLNGERDRPAWLNDMRRISEEQLADHDGTSISATGPVYDADPPKLYWKQDESESAKNARAKLIDMVCGIRPIGNVYD